MNRGAWWATVHGVTLLEAGLEADSATAELEAATFDP